MRRLVPHAGAERDEHVQARLAGRLGEAGEADGVEDLVEVLRGRDGGLQRGGGLHVEVHREEIGEIEALRAAGGHVDRNGAEVRDVNERIGVVDQEDLVDVAAVLVLQVEPADPRREAGGDVPRIEMLAADAVGVADEHDRAVREVREHHGRDGLVIGAEVGLGVAVVGPEDLVAVGDGHARRRGPGGLDPGKRDGADAALGALVRGGLDLGLGYLRRPRLRAGGAFGGGDVVAQAAEDGVQDLAVVGEAVVADADDGLGADVRPAPRGAHVKTLGGGAARGERREAGEDGVDARLVEAGADLAAVDEPAAVVAREVERAEALAGALAAGPADDHEIVVALAFHLHPVVDARALAVRGEAALGDDALEVARAAEREQGLAVLLDVIERADDAGRGDEPAEQLLAGEEGERAEVAVAYREQVEDHVEDRDLQRGEPDVGVALEVNAAGEALEARLPLIVERDDLAVEHGAPRGERLDGARDLGVRAGDVGAPPAGQAHRPGRAAPGRGAGAGRLLGRYQPDAVELELVDPAGAGGRGVAQGAQHRRDGRRTAGRPERGAERGGGLLERLRDPRGVAELIDSEAAQDRSGGLGEDVAIGRGECVGLLDQQPLRGLPVRACAPRAHERVEAAQLLPAELEVDLAAREALLGRLAGVADAAAVPEDHRAGAVIARGDHRLEIEVLERVVLGADGQPAIAGIEARPPGDREARERSADLEAEIVMAPPCVVQVHDVRALAGAAGRPRRPRGVPPEGLRGAGFVPDPPVFVEFHGTIRAPRPARS